MRKMKAAFKGILLVIGSYVITIAVAAFIVLLAIITLTQPYNCSTVNWTVVILWVMIAVLLFASVAAVRIVARKVIPSVAGRRALVVIHGLVMLASYVVIAFGLMVAFEC